MITTFKCAGFGSTVINKSNNERGGAMNGINGINEANEMNNATANGVNGVSAIGKVETKEAKDTKAAVSAKSKSAKAPVKTSKVVKAAKGKKVAKGKSSKSTKNGKAVKTVKASKPIKPAKVAKIENADGCPYRPTSSYGKLWALLFKQREKGINRADFIKQGAKLIGKDEKHTAYDVAVVASPTKEGTAHPSANRAADHYYVERTEGGLLKLHGR